MYVLQLCVINMETLNLKYAVCPESNCTEALTAGGFSPRHFGYTAVIPPSATRPVRGQYVENC